MYVIEYIHFVSSAKNKRNDTILLMDPGVKFFQLLVTCALQCIHMYTVYTYSRPNLAPSPENCILEAELKIYIYIKNAKELFSLWTQTYANKYGLKINIKGNPNTVQRICDKIKTRVYSRIFMLAIIIIT